MRESTRAVERCRAATSARKRKGLLRARDGATYSYGRQKAPSYRQLPYGIARGGASRYEAEHACLAWETREFSQQHVSKVRDAVDYTRLDRGW